MDDENDTLAGGEELSLDEAAARYASLTSEPVADDQGDEEEELDDSETTDNAEDPEGDEDEDGETGDEDQAEEDEEDQPESEQGRFVADNAKVRLEDGTVVSIADLKKGSLLNADYTRKTQEVAELRRSVESQSSAIQQHAHQLEQDRAYVSQLLQAFMPQLPDPALFDTDPHGYQKQRLDYEQWAAHHQQLSAMAQEAQRQEQERQAAALKEREQREWGTMLEKVPVLKDAAKLNAFVKDIETHGISGYGFTKEELGQALSMDHRQVLVLRDAIAWRKLQAAKANVPSKVEGKPPVQKGSRRLTPDSQKARKQSAAMNRLKQTGSVDDAVAVYLANQKG